MFRDAFRALQIFSQIRAFDATAELAVPFNWAERRVKINEQYH